jgi:LysM repeat protein
VAQPVSDVTPASTYTVGKGDSLWTIAKKNHITVSELAAANNLKAGSSVKMGQKLIVPGKAGAPLSASARMAEGGAAKSSAGSLAPTTGSHAAGETVKHTVKAGETLGAIARKYGVKMGDLATANSIADPAKIRPGMELVIPGWQAPQGKSAKGGAKAASPANSGTATQSPVIPTISVSGDEAPPPSSSDNPPTISVEDIPAAPKKD